VANVTQIPAPRVDLIDPRTGLMSREWFRFFNNLYTLTGGGTTDTSLADLQLAPVYQLTPPDAATADLAPQTVTVAEPQFDLSPRYELGTLASQNADNVTVGNLTASGTVTLSGGTANGVGYLNGSKVFISGAALTFDGTNFATTGTASATKFIPTGGSATGNGMYLPAANTLAWSVNGIEGYRLTTSGMLVGTTATGGSMSNTATVLGGSFSTFTGSTSLPAATATTIATIPSGTRSSYLVTISLNVVDAVNYGAAAIIVVDNSSASLATIKAGALMTLTMSGLNIQATSGAGTTNTGYWSVTRLNNQ